MRRLNKRHLQVMRSVAGTSESKRTREPGALVCPTSVDSRAHRNAARTNSSRGASDHRDALRAHVRKISPSERSKGGISTDLMTGTASRVSMRGDW